LNLGFASLAAWLALALAALVPLQRWMTGSLQHLLVRILRTPRRALYAYAVLFLPGVALHEASHWLAARLLGVRATSFSLLPKVTRNGILRLGYVQIEAVDPVRAALIGAAPLLAGTLALGALGTSVLGLNRLGLAVAEGRPQALVDALAATTSVPWWGLWLYLAVIISNTMLPSRSDRAAWGWMLLGAALLAGVVLLLGWGESAIRWMAGPAGVLLGYLAGAFTLTAALDALVGFPLWALNVVLSRRS
jgi:hypothetical protein